MPIWWSSASTPSSKTSLMSEWETDRSHYQRDKKNENDQFAGVPSCRY
jgi:hypothetical protein